MLGVMFISIHISLNTRVLSQRQQLGVAEPGFKMYLQSCLHVPSLLGSKYFFAPVQSKPLLFFLIMKFTPYV